MINKGYVVGEWSDYFEDYPEENPANQKREPDLGSMSIVFPHLYLSQLTKEELAAEKSKISEINAEFERKALENENTIKAAKLTTVIALDNCPICYQNTMNVFRASQDSFYCECKNCDALGIGPTIQYLYTDIEDKI